MRNAKCIARCDDNVHVYTYAHARVCTSIEYTRFGHVVNDVERRAEGVKSRGGLATRVKVLSSPSLRPLSVSALINRNWRPREASHIARSVRRVSSSTYVARWHNHSWLPLPLLRGDLSIGFSREICVYNRPGWKAICEKRKSDTLCWIFIIYFAVRHLYGRVVKKCVVYSQFICKRFVWFWRRMWVLFYKLVYFGAINRILIAFIQSGNSRNVRGNENL